MALMVAQLKSGCPRLPLDINGLRRLPSVGSFVFSLTWASAANTARLSPRMQGKELLLAPLVYREQSPDVRCHPLRQTELLRLSFVALVEHGALRQLPARQAFAQLFGHAGAGLE
jgi:hypothetical protein